LLQLLNTSIIRIKGGKVINWLQDLFPEIAQRLGVFPGPGGLARLIASWRDMALRAAQVNVVISARMKHYLAGRGVNNTQLIPNWSHEELITPLAHADNPLRQAWGLTDKFIVGYSGNFGRAHEFSEIIEAMTLLSAHPGIYFLFIGEGAALQQLTADIEKQGLTNASFKPYQPREALRYSLGAIDLHLVSLKAGMEDLVLPSKLYGVLAAGRPVAFIGDKEGDMAKLVAAEGIGFAIEHGDGAGLAEKIIGVCRDVALQNRLQVRSRQVFERSYSRSIGANSWKQCLSGLGQS
jgi:glycosyltransferase involved in cell wall biosynthesis